jgi:hypothetical protein
MSNSMDASNRGDTKATSGTETAEDIINSRDAYMSLYSISRQSLTVWTQAIAETLKTAGRATEATSATAGTQGIAECQKPQGSLLQQRQHLTE